MLGICKNLVHKNVSGVLRTREQIKKKSNLYHRFELIEATTYATDVQGLDDLDYVSGASLWLL